MLSVSKGKLKPTQPHQHRSGAKHNHASLGCWEFYCPCRAGIKNSPVIKPAHQHLVQGELYLAACWVCSPKRFLLLPVRRQELRQWHLTDAQWPGLAHERGATADSSPEPPAKTWAVLSTGVQSHAWGCASNSSFSPSTSQPLSSVPPTLWDQR